MSLEYVAMGRNRLEENTVGLAYLLLTSATLDERLPCSRSRGEDGLTIACGVGTLTDRPLTGETRLAAIWLWC